ncbi:acyl-CoA thioesterase [Psychrobacter sp. DM4]|uniref:acyl-CoA thioesterase n=1 Tax=Psychrobacter sp. DM4 TaxID=3440637 RepID=UPI003F4FD284
MNMLLRFFIMTSLLRQQLKQQPVRQNLSEERLKIPVVRHYRVLPHDLGFRDHLPNYRFLSFIELNVTKWLRTCCHQKGIKTPEWIIAMQEIIYLKQIKFLDKMTLKSTLAGWDQKYVYFEHQFFVKDQLMAVGMTKFVLVSTQGQQTPAILDMQGEQFTDVITSWNKHQVAVKSMPKGL